MDLRSKVTSLETQISCLKQDKTQLTAETDLLKTKLGVLEDAKNRSVLMKGVSVETAIVVLLLDLHVFPILYYFPSKK